MPVPSAISSLSQTAGSNSPPGSESPALIDDYLRAHASFLALLRDGMGQSAPVDLASAATADIGVQTSPFVRITGTTTITSFGAAYNGPRFVTFSGVLTLTHNATSLILPGGANITTAADDCCIVVPNLATPSGWRVVAYQRANASPISLPLSTTQGGSGSTYANVAALFAGIKQAATETASGVVELATDAEAQAGTDGAKAVTPDNLGATVLGMGQTWQDVSGSRAIGTTYTNSTGRTIVVSITAFNANTANNSAIAFTVGGVLIGTFGTGASNGTNFQPLNNGAAFPVPPGATYVASNAVGTNTISTWAELR